MSPYYTFTRRERVGLKESACLLSDRPPSTNEADNFIQDFATPFYLVRGCHKIWQFAPLEIVQDHFTNRVNVCFTALKEKLLDTASWIIKHVKVALFIFQNRLR